MLKKDSLIYPTSQDECSKNNTNLFKVGKPKMTKIAELSTSDYKESLFQEVSSLVGARIIRSRKALGLNQTELAQVIGVHRTTLVAFEGGTREPSATELYIIAAACNIEPDWLLTGKERQIHEGAEMTIEDINAILGKFSSAERKKLLKLLFNDFLEKI